jgi:hypothetical protein
MNDGLYNVLGLAQRDQLQGHLFRANYLTNGTAGGTRDFAISGGNTPTGTIDDLLTTAITDGVNGTPRTGPHTRPRSGIFNFYAYVGTYAA